MNTFHAGKNSKSIYKRYILGVGVLLGINLFYFSNDKSQEIYPVEKKVERYLNSEGEIPVITVKVPETVSLFNPGEEDEKVNKKKRIDAVYQELKNYKPEAVDNLYKLYYSLDMNSHEALSLCEKVTQAKNMNDLYILGRIYNDGVIVHKDQDRAEKFFEESANAGHNQAMYEIAQIYHHYKEGGEENMKTAITWYTKAAEDGNMRAMNFLGFLYSKSPDGIPNATLALKWYQAGIKLGDDYAMAELGDLYMEGDLIEKNVVQGIKLYKDAAKKGNVHALDSLGDLYQYGEHVEKDIQKAIKYYRQAADGHLARSMYTLGLIYRYGEGVEKDSKQAFYWYKKAAAYEYSDAYFGLAYMYDVGEGLRKIMKRLLNIINGHLIMIVLLLCLIWVSSMIMVKKELRRMINQH